MVWTAGKAKRLKEAKTQADAEIEQYRNECDAAFRKTEAAVRASVPFSYLSLTYFHIILLSCAGRTFLYSPCEIIYVLESC